MLARRVTSFVILAAFAAIAVFAVLGDPWLAAVFLAVEAVVLGHHAFSLCGRCSNVACGFNRGCLEDGGDAGSPPYSDLPVTRTTVVPLLASYPLAVVAAWRFSPIATIATGAVGLAAHQAFRKLTCSRCGNACVGNCNEHYKAWKSAQGEKTA